ncbi:RNA-directed DNA polymerase, eukaryota, reverse transcriptase zinc-binding domain protein [Tanacetum coccineum]
MRKLGQKRGGGFEDGIWKNVLEQNKGVFGNEDNGLNADVNPGVSNTTVDPIPVDSIDNVINDNCENENVVNSDSQSKINEDLGDIKFEPDKKPESYVNMVRKDEIPKKLNFRPTKTNDIGIEVVVFDELLVKKGSERWKLTASGYFVGYKMTPYELRYNLRRMWGKFGISDIIVDNDGTCLFKFRDVDGLNSVVEKGPWMVNGKPLIVQKWNPEIGMQKSEHCKLPIWVRMTNVPLEACSINGISALASSLGNPLIMDTATATMCHNGMGRLDYAKVLVEMDIEKEFKKVIEVQYRDGENKVKGTKIVNVSYDWKPNACTHCKVFGHDFKDCTKRPKTTEEEEEIKKKEEESKNQEKMVQMDLGSKNNDGMFGNTFGYKKQEYRRKKTDSKGKENANKFSILQTLPDDNPMELNILKDMMIEKWDEDSKKENANGAQNGDNSESDEDDIIVELKIASWNIRGMSTGNKQKEVRNLIRNENLQMCSIIETHIKANNIKEICEKVQIIHMARQFIFCHIENLQSKSKFFCTFVYASNSGFERKSLWKDFYMHKKVSGSLPWAIMGDMNVTMKLEEHSNGGSSITEDMKDFNDCINSVEVEDIGSSGFFYTWTKSLRNPDNSILKKLDRVMVSEEFLTEFEGSHAIFQPFMVSDHFPAILVIPSSCPKKLKSFRFANYIVDKPEFISEVKKGCNFQVEGHMMFFITKKLKHLKSIMTKLNWKNEDLTIRAESLKVKLQEVQAQVKKDPYDKLIKAKAISVLDEYNDAVKDEEKLLAQKAKVDWLNEGDKNTSFFHKVIKGRRSRNRVATICDENGSYYEGDDVPKQFVKHFQLFLGQSSSTTEIVMSEDLFCNVLSHKEADWMVREVTNNEIKEAMFDIGDNRALGPDGYTSLFFKKEWKVMGSDVCDAVKEFFCPLLVAMSYTNASALTNRIKGALNKLVQIHQSAFIPDRLIQDNIRLSQEILRGYGRKNGAKRCAMKIDLQKAYDTVSWNFLEFILKKFRFHKKMVRWIMKCVKTAGFSICINGVRYGYFKGGRGLRQVDPMSPYLFTLIMEMLTLLLQRRIRKCNDFKYHHGCKEMKLVNLCFADDLMIFCNGDTKSACIIKEVLKEFSDASGLFPNLNKSTLFFGSLNHVEKEGIKNIMQFKEGSLPTKYLRVPLITKRLGIKDCQILIDSIRGKTKDWKCKYLSYAGRILLISAVLESTSVYWASVFKLPKTVIKEINGILKRFLWSNGDSAKGKAKVAWKHVCKPKEYGSLGLKDLENWNDALLTKHLWNIASKKDSLWVKWVHIKRLKDKNIWNVQYDPSDSWNWKCLLEIRDKVISRMQYEVDDGKKICMWQDKWHERRLLIDQISNRDLYDVRMPRMINLAEMIQGDTWKWPNEWTNDDLDVMKIAVPRLRSGVSDIVKWANMNNCLVLFHTKEEEIVQDLIEKRNGNNIWNAVRRISLVAVVYFIWQERNQRIFRGEKKSADKLLSVINEVVQLKLMNIKVKYSYAVKYVADTWGIQFKNLRT